MFQKLPELTPLCSSNAIGKRMSRMGQSPPVIAPVNSMSVIPLFC